MISGVNLAALPMFPLILIFPCMKAVCGFKVPFATPMKSSSSMIKVASAVPTFPFVFAVFQVDSEEDRSVSLLCSEFEVIHSLNLLDHSLASGVLRNGAMVSNSFSD